MTGDQLRFANRDDVVVLTRPNSAAAEGQLHLELFVLASQTLGVSLELCNGVRGPLRRNTEQGGRLFEGRVALLHVVDGTGAGERLDPPNACGDARLFRDDERADVACRPDVRPAAQLDAETGDGHDPDRVPVLLSEQRHRALVDGLLGAAHGGLDAGVAIDLRVYHAFDLAALVFGQR